MFDLDAIKKGLGIADDKPLWIFGYGSLMWHPDFEHKSHRKAFLCGYHRRFCIYSHIYRGTVETPGLVLGLDRGGSCHGMAFELLPDQIDDALLALWEREMRVMESAYSPSFKLLKTDDGHIPALAFIADVNHHYYFPKQEQARAATIIAGARGERGSNFEYLDKTVCHLRELGVRDLRLEKLLDEVRLLRSV